VNPNAGAWALAPVATEIELQTNRWLASFIRYDSVATGILVSGGNMANMVCLLAARAAKAPWNVRQHGTAVAGRALRVYCSAETHTWIQKTADISGLGTDAIRWVPTDANMRMSVSALRHQIDRDRAGGDLPFFVVGTAGTVSTGAIDPLPAIAAVCAEHDLWFHVDGAYGGVANALADAPDDLRGLSLADSVAITPHKWLYAPLEAGCALLKHADALPAAFSYHPPYYHFGEQVTNFFDFGPQNSRGFRALKVWLALRQAGLSGYRAMIDNDIALSRELAAGITVHPELELVSRNLSITTFRYVPTELRAHVGTPTTERALNDINRLLVDRLQREGDAFVSQAVVEDRFLLRACIVNFNTTRRDVDALPEIVARVGRRVAQESRS
jgi:glutamate/tyrosine decarboxylase-like PLP-dependent enzyme